MGHSFRDTNEKSVAGISKSWIREIHPFREGNGRLARLLASIMALRSGMPLLYFGSIKGRKKEEYFALVRAGLDRNYKPMEKIFGDVIASTKEA